ncbi:hypothetical protein CYMTET_42368 [Cymbomonas tetramitiformis]|uniref:Uncharacterized protein n=1 Tax=Cymbomonas tetramitiformis TaxID=36881 RepID=A0AAE0C5C0_9CHLO|nr:hypothetical protein CYMTET_42368 [Cymbomonas tetramitiformis]
MEAAKAFVTGQYSGGKAAADAFGIDNPSHVRYYVNKWAETDVEAALLHVECERADAFLRGDTPMEDPHTPAVTVAAAASLASMSQDVTSTGNLNCMSDNVPSMIDASGTSPLLPLDLSTQFQHDSLDSIAHAAYVLEATSSPNPSRKDYPPVLSPGKTPRATYCAGFKWAAQAVKDELLSSRMASKRVLETYGISIHFTTISKGARQIEIASPEKAGRRTFIPREHETRLWEFICALRAMKLAVYKSTVCTYANQMIEGTDIADKFEYGVVDNNWYYGFLDRFEMRTGNQRPLELTRGKWCTADNMHKHYEVVADALVEAKLAVPNPDFDESDPDSCKIHITKPKRVLSFDETRLTMDCTESSKSKQERIVKPEKEDDGEVLVNKGGGVASGVGGSTADGDSLAPLFIFGGADSYKAAWTQAGCSEIDSDTGGHGSWDACHFLCE